MNWSKIIIGLVIIWIIGWVLMKIQKIYAKTKISMQMSSDPEAAIKTAKKNLDSEAITLDEYEKQLIKIAENTGYTGAMLKLSELYNGEKYKNKKNEEKSKFWKEQAVKAGDIEVIMDYYGFSDYDVSSNDYNEMIRNLNTTETKATSEHVKSIAVYLKGIVNFKMGNIDTAKQLFVSISSPECIKESKYMLFQCFIKETNISAAEKILDEMEADKFEITANDYLTLYNYYAAAKRENNKPDYEAEMKYIQKYISSKDADKDTANRIGSDTYYNVAKTLQNGNKDFQIVTINNDIEAFEKAAQFGHTEALYYLGTNYWTGENGRNHYKANEYLLKASQKGHKQAKKILEQYGVDGILIKPMWTNDITYSFMDDYKLTASGNTIKWLQLYYGIQYKEDLIATKFSNTYTKTIKSFDNLINGIHQLYSDHLAQMLKWSIQLLMSYGIDTYDVSDIMSMCRDLSLLPRVPKFEQGLEKIDNRAAQLNIKRVYTQATRRQWKGMGFGTTIGSTIKATVKASVAAEVMNIGSDLLHGIGDSIVKAIDNSEIRDMENKLFENPNTIKEFNNAVISACINIADVTISLIEKHCNIIIEELQGNIIFENKNLAEIDDRTLNAKINNNISAQKYEYVYALLIEKLRRRPLDANVFEQIIILTAQKNKTFVGKEYESIIKYVGDFKLNINTQNLATVLKKSLSNN